MRRVLVMGLVATLLAGSGFLLAQGQGRLVLSFKDSPKAAHKNIRKVLSASSYLKDMVAHFNQGLRLPRNIPARFEDCGEENAYYDPDSGSISMCYELIDTLGSLEDGQGLSKEDQLLNATNFTLLHELGHALAHQLRLPITGKEEDAVDEFAALALLKLGDEASIVSAVYQFWYYSDQAGGQQQVYWDSHSLDAQRMYDMACIVYGSNRRAFADLVRDIGLPKERLEECAQEYKDARYAWNTILRPHLRNPAKPLL
ncbi:MAG: DUF4344 domain-containing metallopeptidase [Meiothermus sp.]|nr:DUF4344 domain-containing metallopeptidase [Meiothermus sp.]